MTGIGNRELRQRASEYLSRVEFIERQLYGFGFDELCSRISSSSNNGSMS
jgi:hypothetical protein